MELKAGYKNTEIGVIPVEWKVKTLGYFFVFKNGLNKEKEYFGHGTPIVNYMDVYNNLGISQSSIKGLVSVSFDELRNYEVKKGDVFFTRTSETTDEIGITTVVLDELKNTVFSGFILRARPKNNQLINDFKKYCFSSSEVRKGIVSMSSYTTRALTNGTLLSNVKIPLPPLPEQIAIATVLSDTDYLIQGLEKKIAKKRLIKKGAMQKLLTPKEGWEVKTLGKIAEITSAGVDKKINPNERQVILLNYMDVFKRDYIFKNELNHKVTAPHNKLNSCNVKKGDIFLTPSSELRTDIGISAMAMEDMEGVVYSYHVYRLRYFIDLDILFGLYILKTRQFLEQSEIMCEGSGKRYVVSMGKFRSMNVSFPKSKEEQTCIAQILSDIDSDIESLNKKLAKYKLLKQGLMQNLLMGKIRLV